MPNARQREIPSDAPPLRAWETIESREVLSALPWLKVSVERVLLPDGRVVDDFYRVYMPDSVIVFARTPDGRVVVERAYRHGIGKVSLVLPTGGLADLDGVTINVNAVGEEPHSVEIGRQFPSATADIQNR